MKLKSDAEILRYVKRSATEKNIHISPVACAIFIALARLFLSDADYDEEKSLYYIQYSCQDLANILQFSVNTLSTALQKLDACGLIQRIPVKKDFRRLKGGSVSVNKPHITYLDLDLFLEHEIV